jgi:hypothetical protein
VSLILLAALVWAMAPARAKFRPAPLHRLPAGCPRTTPNFVPSDMTELAGMDLGKLSPAQRNHLLFRLNMEPCPCGCNSSIAVCRATHSACPIIKELAAKMLAEESATAVVK